MTLTNKALWMIERNLAQPLTLHDIAAACGVSPHHLAHAFGASAGRPVMQYVRSRRLTEAAEALANGAPDILGLALDSGYGSHEAFSRAFRLQFGTTPEMIRRGKSTEDLPMVKAARIPEASGVALPPPRMVSGAPMLVAGFAERFSTDATQGIAALWRRFMVSFGDIPDKTKPIPLSVVTNMDEDGNFEYVCGAEVSSFAKTPKDFVQVRVPAQKYAVFEHSGHVHTISATYAAIWNDWRGSPAADGPSLERFFPAFDPQTGLGGVEICIPVKDPA